MRARPRSSATARWLDWRIDDRHGHRVGTLAAVYEDEDGPAWFLVRLAGHTARHVLVPPADVLATKGRVRLPYARETIESAPPCFAVPVEIAPEMETRMRHHFGMGEGDDGALRLIARRTVA